jgi:hypothetical protein
MSLPDAPISVEAELEKVIHEGTTKMKKKQDEKAAETTPITPQIPF